MKLVKCYASKPLTPDQCIHCFLDTVYNCTNMVVWCRCSEEMVSGLMRIRYQTLFSSTLQTWCRDGLSDKLTSVVYYEQRQRAKIFYIVEGFYLTPECPKAQTFFHICNYFAHSGFGRLCSGYNNKIVPQVTTTFGKIWILRVGFAHYARSKGR